jgi:undecaprenyl-diphosphatase
MITAAVLPWYQALLMGLLQGVTELFPVSSLGHAVLFPKIFGWTEMARAQSQPESYFLALLVALHVGTAFGLIIYYRATWIDLFRGLWAQLSRARTEGPSTLWAVSRPNTDAHYRLLFLLVLGTIPVGLVGLVFEHKLRTIFSKPHYAAIFLTVNGCIMLVGELIRRRVAHRDARHQLANLGTTNATIVGSSQIAALFAGISRSGASMVAGLLRGLNHADAAEFSFLLATPVILLAGLYKIPELFGPLGDGIRVQALVAAVVSGIAAFFSLKFLARWFTTHTLWIFGVYCIILGVICMMTIG